MQNNQVSDQIKSWLEQVVIGLNLCPFARKPLVQGKIRFAVSEACSEQDLLNDLGYELELMSKEEGIETTLLIHPHVLKDFYNYNQFLDLAEAYIEQQSYQGTFQIASFHPDYQFGGTEPDDVENFTNRSPYPMLHLLRETSVEYAISHHPAVDTIPETNIRHMQKLGFARLTSLFSKIYGR